MDKEKNFLDLELTQKKSMDSEWDLLSNKGDLLVLKWMSNNYRRSSVLILDRNMVIVAELQRTYEEQRRTAKNSGTLMWIYGGEVQGLTYAELRRRFVAFLWSRQVDAAA